MRSEQGDRGGFVLFSWHPLFSWRWKGAASDGRAAGAVRRCVELRRRWVGLRV
ncbi:hypothetical protein [Microbacterium enclense]|uniref:hypothetical protein n=1 Tax=Microbacterium enclense TaxID=993073 RepID=UPI001428D459|nr:hypothetical protein [Microbacterium enclense]